MSEEIIVIYGSEWCVDCWRARRFLDNHQIKYNWININHSKQAEEFVMSVNRGMKSVPTIVFPDGSLLVEPSNKELAKKFGLS